MIFQKKPNQKTYTKTQEFPYKINNNITQVVMKGRSSIYSFFFLFWIQSVHSICTTLFPQWPVVLVSLSLSFATGSMSLLGFVARHQRSIESKSIAVLALEWPKNPSYKLSQQTDKVHCFCWRNSKNERRISVLHHFIESNLRFWMTFAKTKEFNA